MRLRIVTKECIVCGEKKPLYQFPTYKTRKGDTAYLNRCKGCSSLYKKKHYQQNKDSYLLRSKSQREKNPESYKEYMKQYYKEHSKELGVKSKEYADNHRKEINAYHSIHRKLPENRIKEDARKMVQLALQFGILIRPEVCEHCGKECFCEAHHRDYTKPLDVDWLCKQCHENEHHLNEGDVSVE
jgi:DNA polymerase III delta prime subunit